MSQRLMQYGLVVALAVLVAVGAAALRTIVSNAANARMVADTYIVNDGDAALAYLSGEPPYDDRLQYPLPTLVLLDLKLPRKSGLEVLAWIRAKPHLHRLPVVVLTSSRERRDVNAAYDLHVNSYLVKPVAFDALLELIKSVDLYWIISNEKPGLTPNNEAFRDE